VNKEEEQIMPSPPYPNTFIFLEFAAKQILYGFI
jgi:hypothetical protein